MGWIYALSSVTGTRHKAMDVSCQDSCDARIIYTKEGDLVFVSVASDGAGTARCAQIGSRLACSIIMDGIKDFLGCGNEVINLTRSTAEGFIIDFQEEVQKYAELMEMAQRDYACTVITAVIGYKAAVFFQIGDGAAVISKSGKDEYTPVFWPDKGEYENTTHFAADYESIIKYMRYELVEDTVSDIAIFTDGLERLALHYQNQSAFKPFFKPIFHNIRSLEEGHFKKLSDSITLFLNSARVNTRTDDDKTLIIASRCD